MTATEQNMPDSAEQRHSIAGMLRALLAISDIRNEETTACTRSSSRLKESLLPINFILPFWVR